MKVRDVMTLGAECIDPEAPLTVAAERMRELDVGVLPVFEGGRVAGIVTDRDIVLRSVALGHSPRTDLVRNVMTPAIHYCFEDQDVEFAAQVMKDKQVRRLPVLNREEHLVGILSLGDLSIETNDERLAGRVLMGISNPFPV